MSIKDKIVQKFFDEAIGKEVDKRFDEQRQRQELEKVNIPPQYAVPSMAQAKGTSLKKPVQHVASFKQLRDLSIFYPIARACVNRRKTQMTGLAWNVISKDEEKEPNVAQVEKVKEFFNEPSGHETRFRELVDMMVEDLMVLDAVSLYKEKTFGEEIISLLPIDPGTIKLRVDKNGRPPLPPEAAYIQIVNGKQVAEMTTDEMFYECMNPRSNTPYGLSPLESLVVVVESALRGSVYNLAYLSQGNIPEGFLTLPEGLVKSANDLKEWQNIWDTLLAGDPRFQRRLKILPGGSKYQQSKKPSDMAFEKFELWLLQQTCAVFAVPPQDIGITYQVNKATGETQATLSEDRGKKPLANFLKEVFDRIIQRELGFEELQWMWTNLDPIDEKLEADLAEKEIKMGAMSVDEYRASKGKEKIGLGHYIMTAGGPVLVESLVGGDVVEVKAELKRWRKVVYNCIDQGKKVKTFQTDIIDDSIANEIREGLRFVKDKKDAFKLFQKYIEGDKPDETVIKAAVKLRRALKDL